MPLSRLALLPILFLTACATTAPLVLDGSHPASVTAPSSPVPAATPMLRSDADTLRTRQLLTERETQP